MKLVNVTEPRGVPAYRSEDGRVVIQRFGSLPSCHRWVAFLDGEKVSAVRDRTRRDAVAAAEAALGRAS